jgi:hypothetical protein
MHDTYKVVIAVPTEFIVTAKTPQEAKKRALIRASMASAPAKPFGKVMPCRPLALRKLT